MKSIDRRSDFPVLQDESLVYLDTAASSLTPQVVLDAMDEYYQKYGVNVHRGVYQLSYVATEKYEHARQAVADFLNASFEEIIFTRGASSALNLVASSYGLNHLTEGDEIVVSELEHHSHVLPWQNVARITGATLIYVPLNDEGRITVDAVASVLSERTKIVALTYVSNVMGYITPIKDIIRLAHEVGALVSVDAAQAAPHIQIDARDLDCDFLAFSGHKMLGPTGIGVLYGKRHLLDAMPPIEFGGDMNDNVDKFDASWKDTPYKFETGTPPIAEALGLHRAIEYLNDIGMDSIHAHELALKDYAIAGMKRIDGITIYNKTTDTGVITFNLDGVHPHDVITYFDQDNICMRAGHHCAQLVVKWLQVPATLRLSFYLYNTTEDVDRFLTSLQGARDFFTTMGF
jgi:cysteine desulfurase/selenocysteine lyase